MTMAMMHDERGRGRILERGAVMLAVGGSGSLLNAVDARRSTRAPIALVQLQRFPLPGRPTISVQVLRHGPPCGGQSIGKGKTRKKRAYTQAGHSYHIRHRGTSKKGMMRHACRVEYRMCELGTDRARSTEPSTRARCTANRPVIDLRAPG